MSEPVFDIVIPSFNRYSFLDKAIESVYRQKYQKWKLWVVDDGSQDETCSLVQRWHQLDSRISFHIQQNQGVSVARNKGISLGNSPWICLLDSDDRWLDHKLEVFANYLINHPETKILHSNEKWIRHGLHLNQMKKHQKGGGDQFLRSLDLCLISPSAVCLSREMLEKHKNTKQEIFDSDFTVCEDYDLWLRLTCHYQVDFVQEILIEKYGGHQDQLSQKFHSMDYFRLLSITKNLSLFNSEQKLQAHQVFQKKLSILLNGAKKHNNQDFILKLNNLHDQFQKKINDTIMKFEV
jgi:glycosyltransferase involved in cell wall biosynthesis